MSKKGVAVSWPVDELDGIECLRASALRHHYGRHCHDAYAIGVIEAGVGGNRCRGGDHVSAAGSIVVMNPGETHTGYTVGHEPLSYRMFYIPARALLKALPEKAALPRKTGTPGERAVCRSPGEGFSARQLCPR